MNDFSKIKLDRTSPLPLFYQLAEKLRAVIESSPAENSKLPSERKIASLLNIDRSTVNNAYNELQKQGVIVKKTPKSWQICTAGKKRQITFPPCIGVVMPDKFASFSQDSFAIIAEYFKGFLDAANENSVSVAMFQLPDANSRSAADSGFIRDISRQVLGLIHLGDRILSLDSPLQKLMNSQELPQAIISAETDRNHILQIVPDELPGAEKLALRLNKLNIRKIGVISPFDSFIPALPHPYFAYSSLKRDSFLRDFFINSGFVCEDSWNIFQCSNYQAVLENIRRKKAANDLPQLYCCHNDTIAAWVILACAELGIDVPGELSVVGFNGMPSAKYEGLATLKHPFYEIGHAAVCELLEVYRNGASRKKNAVKIATDFIDGSTLGKTI